MGDVHVWIPAACFGSLEFVGVREVAREIVREVAREVIRG